jgi:hypothetical protein
MPPSPDYKQFLVYAVDDPAVGYEFRARPSIHMPRWASRITLEITDVRVERLQDIGTDDARAEGMIGDENDSPTGHYETLWDKLNAKRGFGWDVNPWVWALTFRLVTPPPSIERK